jgi:ABC-2 type transport system ATP-binding protein
MNAPTAERNWTRTPAAAAGDALRVLGLEKSFTRGFWRRRVPAVRGVSFVVPRGAVFALLGHNGAGKTTTLGCILGLVHPDAGEIAILGEDNRRPASRRRVGYLPEQPYFYEHLTARELLGFYARLQELPAREADAEIPALLERVGLAHRAGGSLRKFSKGMMQRLGLAQALLGRPDLLVLDEPMSGLDPIGRREVRELLAEEKERGTTILLSSHIVPDVEVLADAAVFLREGLLVGEHDLDRSGPAEFVVRASRAPAAADAEPVLARCRRLPARTGATVRHANDGAAEPAVDDAGPALPGEVEPPAETLSTPDEAAAAEPVALVAPDPAVLARLLDACSSEGIDVLDVRARRSDLEDLFLAAMAGRRPAEGERPC